jgi:malate synthase
VTLSDRQQVSTELVQPMIEEEMAVTAEFRGDAFRSGRWDDARALFTEMALADEYNGSLTVPADEPMP